MFQDITKFKLDQNERVKLKSEPAGIQIKFNQISPHNALILKFKI